LMNMQKCWKRPMAPWWIHRIRRYAIVHIDSFDSFVIL
jgi:hypothetical protein